jgi:hypothetical protein
MSTSFPTDAWHLHERRCYWDHTRCGWICPAEAADPPADKSVHEPDPEPHSEPASRAML